MCLVCGMDNPFGLKAAFYELENEEIIALFTPKDEHQSYPGRLHGGLTAAMLDETIGRAILIRYQDIWGVTVDFNIRYRLPVPLDQELKVVGRIIDENARIFQGSGELFLPGGKIAATAWGKYFKMPLAKIADVKNLLPHWKVYPGETDPVAFEK